MLSQGLELNVMLHDRLFNITMMQYPAIFVCNSEHNQGTETNLSRIFKFTQNEGGLNS